MPGLTREFGTREPTDAKRIHVRPRIHMRPMARRTEIGLELGLRMLPIVNPFRAHETWDADPFRWAGPDAQTIEGAR
jgi:hypothetical protein